MKISVKKLMDKCGNHPAIRNQTIVHYAMAFSVGKAYSTILKKHYSSGGMISFAAVPHVLGKIVRNGDQV